MDIILILALIVMVITQVLLGRQMDLQRKAIIRLIDLNAHALDARNSRRARGLHEGIENR